jgi:hypothetical protein
MYDPDYPMRKRVTGAIWAFILNLFLWIVVPYYLSGLLAGRVPQSALTGLAFVYEFGILFIILEVCAAFFHGKAISVPFISGAALLSVAYIWLATNGGYLTVNASALSITLSFQLILIVLILPVIWAAVSAPLSYLIWRRNWHPQPPLEQAPPTPP